MSLVNVFALPTTLQARLLGTQMLAGGGQYVKEHTEQTWIALESEIAVGAQNGQDYHCMYIENQTILNY